MKEDWINLVDRGGLTRVNDNTFEVFRVMEYELRKHLSTNTIQSLTLGDDMKKSIVESEDVQFFWSMVSGDWDEESVLVLLEMVVSQWIKIRGFSYASAWVEKYKVAQKTTLQKSKGVRKQLLPTAPST